MRKEELRIGNFISDNHATETYYAPVQKLDYQRCFFGKATQALFHAAYSDLKPIHLTEEWLLRFGFKLCTKSGVHNGWGIGENPLTKDYLLFIVWMKNQDGALEECFYQNGHFKIEYVHELQNLFYAITREELELKEKGGQNND